MTTNPDARGPFTGGGYRMVPLMPDPRVQLERTAAAARAHAAQARTAAQLAQQAAQRAYDKALTAKRWNTAAVLISTLSLGMAIAMLLGWL